MAQLSVVCVVENAKILFSLSFTDCFLTTFIYFSLLLKVLVLQVYNRSHKKPASFF